MDELRLHGGRGRPAAVTIPRFLFIFHGAQKLFGALGGQGATTGWPSHRRGHRAGRRRVVAVGLVAGIAAFVASALMAVA